MDTSPASLFAKRSKYSSNVSNDSGNIFKSGFPSNYSLTIMVFNAINHSLRRIWRYKYTIYIFLGIIIFKRIKMILIELNSPSCCAPTRLVTSILKLKLASNISISGTQPVHELHLHYV